MINNKNKEEQSYIWTFTQTVRVLLLLFFLFMGLNFIRNFLYNIKFKYIIQGISGKFWTAFTFCRSTLLTNLRFFNENS